MGYTIAILLGVLAFFVGLGQLVRLRLARVSGWRQMAERWRADRKPDGLAFWISIAWVGEVRYKRALNAVVAREGLYLAPFLFRAGHRPLLIPWEELHSEGEEKGFLTRYAKLSVGRPAITTLLLPPEVWEAGQNLD